jgi:hypothetical protein
MSLKDLMTPEIPMIMDAVFEPTVQVSNTFHAYDYLSLFVPVSFRISSVLLDDQSKYD